MKKVLCVALAACLGTGVAYADGNKGDDLKDPMEILKKVDAAAKAVKAAKFKATTKGTLAGQSRMPQVEGTVVMAGEWRGQLAEKFRVEARVKRPNSAEEKRITIGSDGDEFYVIDHANKKAYVDIDPAVIGATGRPATSLFVPEFLHLAPFNDELNGKKQELRGSKVIGGEDCYEVFVAYANDRQEALWHFGKKDFLPRARLDTYSTPNGERAGMQRIITDLVIDPKIDESIFKFKLPAGYEKIDDFAP